MTSFAVNMTIADAVNAAFSEIEDLGGEIREVVDNANESAQATQRMQTLDETASAHDEDAFGNERDEVEELRDACQEAIDNWDGAEFPGIYG